MTIAPLYSVVVPTFRRPDALRACLCAWARQRPVELPFEVVVVDDGSEDGATDEVLSGWRDPRFSLLRLRQENSGPAAARNRALASARGRRVFFAGDDIEPSEDLLDRHDRGHRDHPGPEVAVVGRTRWAPDLRSTRTMVHVDGVGGQQFGFHWMENDREYDFRHFYTSNVSIERAFLDREPGPFSTAFPAAAWEDAELGYRLSRHGLRVVYREDAVALHHHEYDVDSFFRRQVVCGRAGVALARLWPELSDWARLGEISGSLTLLLREEPRRRRVFGEMSRRLEDLERAARAIAATHDDTPTLEFAPLDTYLTLLMEYAVVSGAAGEWLEEESSRAVRARVFATRLLPAVLALIRDLRISGLPSGPAADRDTLTRLASEIPPP